MSTTELASKISELRQLQRLIEEAEQEAEVIKDDIKLYMGSCEEISASEYRVSWKTVVSSRLDSKALKAALPDVFKAFSKETVTRPFKVS